MNNNIMDTITKLMDTYLAAEQQLAEQTRVPSKQETLAPLQSLRFQPKELQKFMQHAVRCEVRRCHAKRDLYDQQKAVNHYAQLFGEHPDSDEYFEVLLELERAVREELGYGDYGPQSHLKSH